MANSKQKPSTPARAEFATTSWTRVLGAARGDEVAGGELERLCQDYWYPLYAFLRRSGQHTQDAEDTVQAFFAWLVESKFLERADPERGRFRNFLMASLRQFQAREQRHQSAAKRKPERPIVNFDSSHAEVRYQRGLAHNETPEVLFERAWAVALIERTLQHLKVEMEAAGKAEQFEGLRGMLTGQRETSGREAAELLGLSEGAVRVALHRLKGRFGELLREQVAGTLESPAQIDDEMRELFASVSSPGEWWK